MCIDSYADISIHTPTRGTTAGTGTATNLAEFQSTFPREERPYYTIVRIQVLQFQSTLPREERRKKQSYNVRNRQFQSTLPREERPLYAFNIILYVYFNPRSHERSDTDEWLYDEEYLNFNPRSHERSDAYSPCLFFKKGISIHAPTRGATPSGSNGRCVLNYFNPRSHERSDIRGRLKFGNSKNFNPRSHERSDVKTLDPIDDIFSISIHAPTRGATTGKEYKQMARKFQSTLPREERLHADYSGMFRYNFNPRSHERSDSNIAQKICLFLYNTDNKYIIR